MRAIADEQCMFVHIGITADLNKEISFYTSGAFKPSEVKYHHTDVNLFNDTAVLINDLDYSLLLNG